MTSCNQFEAEFAKWLSVPHAFSFWKARVAFYAALKALGVGPGDEVILTGYTCVMNVNPIKYLGAKPVYIDIEPDTFNINPDLIEAQITPKTKVLLAQHTYGYPCRMDAIAAIAKKHNLTLIEDCCLCLGSTYNGKTAGTFGKAAYFSFQWNKPFTTGLGGMLLTSDQQLADKIRQLKQAGLSRPSFKEVALLAAELAVYRLLIYPRTTALAQQAFRFLTKKGAVVGSSSSAEFDPVMAPDFFKAMSSVQISAGCRQIRKVQKNIAHRKQMTALYDELLAQKGFPARVYDKSLMDPVLVRYPLRIKEKDKALELAASAGVELGSWFECTLHPIETPLEKYDYTQGMCPQAEMASQQTVNLPLHPRVSENTVRRTVDFISQFTPIA
ncbi:MAG TPA: DegT/DnrJ/EryC1/StrS family aminotransferase [Anaerohalosphaeraceae bacterium]|nr:DegT/DnrJ/EryC1/StrS family aminotransferase [Anaerohalosphaeraceae bacterium]